MKILNLTAQELFLGFVSDSPKGHIQDVSSNGVKLLPNAEITLDDRYRSNRSLELMISEGLVSVSSLSVSDDVDSDFASANELHSHVRGIYAIDDSWSKLGTAVAATPANLASALDGPYDTTRYYALSFRFDSLASQEIRIDLPKGQLPKASLITALTGNADFAKYAVINDLGAGLGFNIESLALGVNSNVEILEVQGNVNAILGLEAGVGVLTAGTGAIAEVSSQTLNASAEGVSGIAHAVKLYTTDLPGVFVDGNHQIQRISKGKLISGLYTAEAVIETGDDGEIVLEVAQVSAGAAPFYGVEIPAGHFLAQHPAARVNLA